MSFYTYYGKQGNDLFVAVLPNGTIEHGDPIYLYTKDQFTSHRAKTVIVSADGEDVVSFGNELFQYQATSKKGYRELGLTLKHTSKSFDISLTRLYDLPLSVVPVTDEPKIWTGIFNFHEWANTESIIVIAPKGLGNDKPIVCLWQWTKDNKGVKNTLSTSHAKQISAASNASSFSFKQGDYYTLECNVNATTKGLDVEVKSSSNSSSNLTLKLSAEVKLGSDHNFSPPRPVQKKLELDCSRPQTTPALPRMTGLLPFPGNLVDTLTYSAAFVDQAGYLAKHAVKQFNQLEKSFQQLEIKSEARGARIIVLEDQLNEANEKNTLLTNENRLLKEQLAAAAELAKKQLAELQKKLDDSLAREKDLKRLNKSLVAENAKLRAHIDADELADLLREQEWLDREREHAEHDAQDLARQLQLEADLRKANQTIQDLRKKLQDKEREIGQLEAKLEFKNGQLKAAEAIIAKLRVDLKKERADRARVEADLRRKLQEEERQREILQAKLAEANNKIVDLECKVESQKGELEMLKAALQAADIKIVDLECKIESQNGVIDRLTAELKESRDAHEVTKAALHKTEATLKETEETLTKEREEREQEVANLKSKHAAEKKELVAKHERDIAAEKKKVTAKEAEKSAALDLVARTNELLKAKEVERDDMEKASSEKEEEHKKEIEDLEKKQREEIADLQRKHDKKIAELETKHKKIVDDLKPRVLDATTKKDTVIVSSTEIVN